METRINSREIVTDMLMDVTRNNTFSHILLKKVLDKYNYIEESEKAFIKRLFEGTLEREITLDHVINSYSKTPVDKMKPFIQNLMRMSVYQILYMDRVPDRAVINEAVKLAKKRKFVNLSGFVNAVLRKIADNKENCLAIDDLSIKYAAGELFIDSLKEDYGIEKTESILKLSLEQKPIIVRIREDLWKSEIDAVIEEWNKEKVRYKKLDYPDYAYAIENTGNLERLACFKEGLYAVMDASSMMVCEKAHIRQGDLIIDVCAAPGGKSLHAVSKGAIVEARDISEYKVSLIEENIKRLKAVNITTKVWDATVPDEASVEAADIVFADVPCSGFGVIGKKPDIKRNITKDGLESIVRLQRSIIDAVYRYAKVGGYLMYSTCTLRKAENEEQVRYITEHYPYELEEMETLFPDKDRDGFFIARLKRIG